MYPLLRGPLEWIAASEAPQEQRLVDSNPNPRQARIKTKKCKEEVNPPSRVQTPHPHPHPFQVTWTQFSSAPSAAMY